ncbi:hypothetical protein [Metabacillus bambusae]|uniref:Uncharacterized protein n=1 Tax=Metabacillus bambusae TaxID=2795218 RepID=A0ABS3NB45_9BACI|nr:hypothetical protein [Metabacillus bambusae]MBO1515275.1 hypothetical protein [Metabacillus bambusae]
MTNKDEYQQDSIKFSIWNTNTEKVHLEHDLTNRSKAFKNSLNNLGQASQLDDLK